MRTPYGAKASPRPPPPPPSPPWGCILYEEPRRKRQRARPSPPLDTVSWSGNAEKAKEKFSLSFPIINGAGPSFSHSPPPARSFHHTHSLSLTTPLSPIQAILKRVERKFSLFLTGYPQYCTYFGWNYECGRPPLPPPPPRSLHRTHSLSLYLPLSPFLSPVLRIRIRLDLYIVGSPGSRSVHYIRIRIQQPLRW